MAQTKLPLTVIIPVHNGANTLRACLASVCASDASPAEIIVVDDGSTDGSEQIAAGFPCRILRMPSRMGAASARNAGARSAAGELFFFLDSDIQIRPDTLRRIADFLFAHPEISALFGSYQKETVPTNFVSIYKNLLHHYTHQVSSSEAATFCAGFGAVRAAVFRELGGFDEKQRALEDIEFGYRLHRSGRRIFLDQSLQFTHAKRYSLCSLVKSDVFSRSIPWTKLMLRERIFRNDLNTKPNNILSVLAVGSIVALLFSAPMLQVGPAPIVVLAALLVMLNFDFYKFVFRERGLGFTLAAIALNWFNYLYSGIGLILGVLEFLAEGSRDWIARRVQPS